MVVMTIRGEWSPLRAHEKFRNSYDERGSPGTMNEAVNENLINYAR